jgi:hypothetical protein
MGVLVTGGEAGNKCFHVEFIVAGSIELDGLTGDVQKWGCYRPVADRAAQVGERLVEVAVYPISGCPWCQLRLLYPNMRKLRIRWEKKAENYQALVMLASALILYRRIVLG